MACPASENRRKREPSATAKKEGPDLQKESFRADKRTSGNGFCKNLEQRNVPDFERE
jgi:hypothetical protein